MGHLERGVLLAYLGINNRGKESWGWANSDLAASKASRGRYRNTDSPESCEEHL